MLGIFNRFFLTLMMLVFVLGSTTIFAMSAQEAGALTASAVNNDQSSFVTLQSTAQSGDATAQDWLGFYYEYKKDYTQAAQWYRKAADQGLVNAQESLGGMYDIGRGVLQNYVQAVQWFRKAADQGNLEAQYNLGVMYDKGHGVTQDYTQAVQWFRKAAEQGGAAAQYNLGVMYDKGQGVAQDYPKLFSGSARRLNREVLQHSITWGQCMPMVKG